MNKSRTNLKRNLYVWAVASGLLISSHAYAGHLPPLSDQARQNAREQIKVLAGLKAALSTTEQKLDSQFIFALRADSNGVVHPSVPKLRHGLKFEQDGRLKVEIVGTVTPELLKAVQTAGGTVLSAWPETRSLFALMPLAAIKTVAARPEVTFIRPPPRESHHSLDSQGDTTHQAIPTRANYAVTGSGIKVGVLSDSIDNGSNALSAAIASGNIDPANTFVIPGQAGTGEGEGLAMCEIVHDLAPGAQIYFATGSAGQPQMAANILALAQAGCKIICDDEAYNNESPFQDQAIAQAVVQAANLGVLYFSCARNSGNADSLNSCTWEGDFIAGKTVAGYGQELDFTKGQQSPAVTEDGILDEGFDFRADLFWSDPLGASANDYDLYMLDSFGDIIYASQNPQTGTQDPYEDIPDAAQYSSGYYLVVTLYSGANRYLHLDFGRGVLDWATAGCLRGHNACDATNEVTVAATPANTAYAFDNPVGPYPNPFTSANVVEYFSADGPRRMFYNAAGTAYTPGNVSSTGGLLFRKPDMTAADGVACTPPGFNPFFGTSAATPHAAAIAALVWSYSPTLTAAQVRAVLTNSCIDIMTNGFDRDSGWGILMANKALQNTPVPLVAQFVPGTTKYSGGNQFQVSLSGVSGSDYDIYTSTNLSKWSKLTTVTMTNAVTVFKDSTATGKQKYYRTTPTP